MITNSKRSVQIAHNGPIIVIRMRGGPDCLWLNMYLDTQSWQMTCDSDVGSYAFYFGPPRMPRSFLRFCIDWLGDENFLLRKCVGERDFPKSFLLSESESALRATIYEYYGDDDSFDPDVLDDILCDAAGYAGTAQCWSFAVQVHAEWAGFLLPEEWYECIREDYSPMQKRFAEICKNTIAPELERWCIAHGF